MVGKEKVEKAVNEINALLEAEQPPEHGFRKGITKKSIVKSLSPEDWKFIDKCKEAEEKKVNPLAYKFFLKSDQAVQECNRIQAQIINDVAGILLFNHQMQESKIKISLGDSDVDVDGNKMSLDEMHYINMKTESKIRQAINVLYTNLSRLFTFVGHYGLDKKVFYTEEDYNEFVKNIIRELEKTPYKL